MVPLSHDEISLVAKGSFNPAIFSPDWLLRLKLIGPGEHERAQVDLITGELTQFTCAWLQCGVTKDTLQISSPRVDEFERTRDVMAGILRILDHTPISALGINRTSHFEVPSVERWHEIGDKLVPKAPWSDVLQLPGLRNLTLLAIRQDNYSGRIQVSVEPSNRLPHGISIAYNDHYELEYVKEQPTKRIEALSVESKALTFGPEKVTVALDVLKNNFQSSLDRSDEVIEHVYKVGG